MPSSVDDDDAAAFAEAMRGVRPLAKGGARAIGRGAGGVDAKGSARAPRRASSDAAATDYLVERTAESIAGRAPDLAAKTLRDLQRGQRPPEAKVDLHGRTRAEAVAALGRFLTGARGQGRRVVLIVHGRGRGSEAGDPVLRPAVWAWLESRAAVALGVMAFATAPPRQGGAGATLVLLRRAASPSEIG